MSVFFARAPPGAASRTFCQHARMFRVTSSAPTANQLASSGVRSRARLLIALTSYRDEGCRVLPAHMRMISCMPSLRALSSETFTRSCPDLRTVGAVRYLGFQASSAGTPVYYSYSLTSFQMRTSTGVGARFYSCDRVAAATKWGRCPPLVLNLGDKSSSVMLPSPDGGKILLILAASHT